MGCDSPITQTPEEDTTKLWPAGNLTDYNVGFINAKGEMVIPAQYYEAYRFSGGKAKVLLTAKQSAFIDENGKLLYTLPYGVSCDNYFSYGCCVFGQIGAYGMYDTDFNLVIPAENLWVGTMTKEGLAYYAPNTMDGRTGYINKAGDVIIEPQFAFAASFCDGIAVVSYAYEGKDLTHRSLYGAINTQGELMIDTIYEHLESVGSDRVVYYSPGGYSRGLMDTKGNIITEPFFGVYTFFGDNDLMPVTLADDNKKFGYIDRNGTFQIPCIYYDATPFYKGEAWVATEKSVKHADFSYTCQYELINTKGETLLTLKNKSPLAGFHNGLCPVNNHENNLLEYIDKQGNVVYSWHPNYTWYPQMPEKSYTKDQKLRISMFEGTEYYPLAIQSVR